MPALDNLLSSSLTALVDSCISLASPRRWADERVLLKNFSNSLIRVLEVIRDSNTAPKMSNKFTHFEDFTCKERKISTKTPKSGVFKRLELIYPLVCGFCCSCNMD